MNTNNIADKTVYRSDYFFVTKEIIDGRKTPIYYVFTYEGVCIAQIKWYSPWRAFCFYPENNSTVWDSSCLREVIYILDKVNSEWENLKKDGESNMNIKLEWNVLLHDFNRDAIVKYNVLEHSSDLVTKIKDAIKSGDITTHDDLKDFVTRKLKPTYWSRTEYEIMVSGLFSKEKAQKIDVWYQIEMNLDNLIDYLINKLNLNIK